MCFCKDNSRSTGFSLEHYKRDYRFNFSLLNDFKYFSIFKCADCDTIWILDKLSDNTFYTRIYYNNQIDLLHEWLRHTLNANHLKNVAELIGSTSDMHYEVPCKAILHDNSVLDYCILTKWSFHPKISWFSLPINRFIYADQVRQIEPSDYSISLNNRILMRNAQDTIFRDFVPLNLIITDDLYFQDEGCKTYYLDSNFLRYKDFKGSDIIDVNQNVAKYKQFSIKDDLKSSVTLILFDEY
jgi:hypothetical protein